MRLSFANLRRFWNLWPPYLFTGIRVLEVSPDGLYAKVRLRLHFWNRNAFGTHFGGSLLAMVNPFWPLLGRDYYVWDQAAAIDFLKPGRGTVETRFDIDEAVLDEIRRATADGAKYLRWFENEVIDAEGDVVARVRKQVYVRRKPDRRPARGDVPGA
jgi:hypothetical protein